jgi:hypothetical protein
VRDLLSGLGGDGSDEALEMLARAAWWIDDPASCFAAREELFRRRRLAGDDLGAARTAIELAWDATLFRGDRAVARGWAARARSLLADSAPGPERAWLSLRIATLDDAGPAEFARVRALARDVGDVDAEMTAVVLEGRALMAEGRAAEGLARLDEGAAAACIGDSGAPSLIAGSNVIAGVFIGEGSIAAGSCQSQPWNTRVDTPSARAFLGQYVTLP